MRTYTLTEWGCLNIGNNASDDRNVITSDYAERLFAASKKALPPDPGNFDVLTLDRDRIHAHGMVGLLQVDGCSLEILPKINVKAGSESERNAVVRKRFALMTAVALGLNVDDDLRSSVNGHNGNILELLIGIFAKKLSDAVGQKLPKSYVKSKYWPSDSDSKENSLGRDKLTEIKENDWKFSQMLKTSVIFLARIASDHKNQRVLGGISSVFADIPDVSANEIEWDRVLKWNMDHPWRELHSMARFLLNWVNLLDSTGESVEEHSLFVDMGQLFDAYIVGLVRQIDLNLMDITDGKLELHFRDEDDCTLKVMRARQIPAGSDPCIDIRYKGDRDQIVEPKWEPAKTLNENEIEKIKCEWAGFGSHHTVLLYPHSVELGAMEGTQQKLTVANGEFEKIFELSTFDVADGSAEANRLQKILNNLDQCDDLEEFRNWLSSAE